MVTPQQLQKYFKEKGQIKEIRRVCKEHIESLVII